MFHFPGCPPMNLWIQFMVTAHYHGRVSPFGYPWINAYLQLPMAFRSLSRPSSAISALASTLRSYSLDLASFGFLFTPKTIEMIRNPVFAFHPPALLTGIFRALGLNFAECSFLCSFQGAWESGFSSLSLRFLPLKALSDFPGRSLKTIQ